mgnify:FL=1
MNPPLPDTRPLLHRVGIVGGGQLARMMAEVAPALGISVTVLDPTPGAPASEFARQIVAEYDDLTALLELARLSDVVTIDIEAVSASSLAVLEAAQVRVAPSSQVLGIIQDKLLQKRYLAAAGLPVGEFASIETIAELRAFGLPCILKARRHGYDGRGVKLIRNPDDARELLASGPCLGERVVDIERELAVMLARNDSGEIALYPVVEAEFAAHANILNTIHVPAQIDPATATRCGELAQASVVALAGVGIFGIEFFLTRTGDLVLNEISPRPHNSGHYTIEACETSQFAQHLRAVTNMPLGSPRLLHPATSFNLLGELNAHGVPDFRGMHSVAAMAGAAVHLYGKSRVKPYRKMGHITVTAESLSAAITKAKILQQQVRVEGKPA